MYNHSWIVIEFLLSGNFVGMISIPVSIQKNQWNWFKTQPAKYTNFYFRFLQHLRLPERVPEDNSADHTWERAEHVPPSTGHSTATRATPQVNTPFLYLLSQTGFHLTLPFHSLSSVHFLDRFWCQNIFYSFYLFAELMQNSLNFSRINTAKSLFFYQGSISLNPYFFYFHVC